MFKFLASLLGLDNPPARIAQPQQQARPQPRQTTATPSVSGRTGDVNRRARYIRAHAEAMEERFSKDGGMGVKLDPELNYLIIPKYPMPERWRQRWTSLMVFFPPAYPDVPPTGFYLTIKSGLRDGSKDTHLFNGSPYSHVADLSAQGWYWYCVHAQVEGSGGWQPSNDPRKPDNLFTFLNMVREALTTDN